MVRLGYYTDVNGFTPMLVRMRLSGDEIYLSNRYEDVREAIASGEPFEATKVVGMGPRPIVINPAEVASAEVQDELHRTFRLNPPE